MPSLTNYQIRSLGINVEKTSKELIDSGLVLSSFSKEAIESAHSKQELVELCETHGATYKKSWKKEKLVDALQKMDSTILERIAESKNMVSSNYQRHPDLRNVVRIADEHQVGFKLLCFAQLQKHRITTASTRTGNSAALHCRPVMRSVIRQ